MSAAFVAAGYMADSRDWMDAWHGVWRIAVAGMLVAFLCWRVARNREAPIAVVTGFLVGVGCVVVIVLYELLRSHDIEGRAWMVIEMAVGGFVSGVGGAIIGAMNRREE
jgi:predicted membrane channel-forming protein YqfA (hemolysin III family)